MDPENVGFKDVALSRQLLKAREILIVENRLLQRFPGIRALFPGCLKLGCQG